MTVSSAQRSDSRGELLGRVSEQLDEADGLGLCLRGLRRPLALEAPGCRDTPGLELLHQQGRSWAEIAHFVGQRKLSLTADTYMHALGDRRELDYEEVLR